MRFALISLLLATSTLAVDLCKGGTGVCIPAGDCREGTISDDASLCPNDDGAARCCTAQEGLQIPEGRDLRKRHYGCQWIINGACPGGNDVKWVPAFGGCWYISRGYCPGPVDYVRVERPWP